MTSTALAKRSRINTRARLLAAAYDVFATKGFTAASVEDVCASAGFSRGAFYSNFATKEELFLALWDDAGERIVGRVADLCAAVMHSSVPLEDALVAFADRELYDEQWFALKTEFVLHATRHPEAAEMLVEHRQQLRTAVGDLVAALLQASDRRPPDGIDVALLTRMIIAAHEGAQLHSRIEEPPVPLFRAMLELLIASCPPAVS